MNMTACFVPCCNHNTVRETCQFFRFPNNEKERKRWITLIRRVDREPNQSSRICSCHFPNRIKECGPSIFPWNEAKLFSISFPDKMKTTRRRSPKITRVIDNPPVKMVDETELLYITPEVRIIGKTEMVYDNTPLEIVQEAEMVYDNTPVEIIEETELVCDKSTQTINSVLAECEITLLKSEIESLKAENSRLIKQPFRFASIQHNDSVIKYYTGVNKKAFDLLCEMVSRTELKYFYGRKPVNMNVPDQILMTLMKLKLNLDYKDLEVRFNVSNRTIGNIILTFIHVLREVLFESGMENVPYQEGSVSNLPNSYTDSENSRMIVDCAEFCCEAPNCRDEQKETSSTYKHSSTLKGVVGIAPNGSITYASKLCVDSSDKNIARSCNVVDIFKPGDFILTAKKFLLQDNPLNNASSNVPSPSSDPQSTSNETAEIKKRVRSRMHLEKAIRRLRLFRILYSIPKTFLKYSSTIFQLCVALTNYENLIGEVSDCSDSNSTDDSVLENDVPADDN